MAVSGDMSAGSKLSSPQDDPNQIFDNLRPLLSSHPILPIVTLSTNFEKMVFTGIS